MAQDLLGEREAGTHHSKNVSVYNIASEAIHVPVLAVAHDHLGEREAGTHRSNNMSVSCSSSAPFHVPVLAVAQDLLGEREARTYHSKDVSVSGNPSVSMSYSDVRLPPYFDWLSVVSQPSDSWHAILASKGLRISSIFSGIGSEMRVSQMLIDHFNTDGATPYSVSHTCSFEISKAARDVLRLTSTCPLFGDLCSLLPPSVRAWTASRPRSFRQLKNMIIDEKLRLLHNSYCSRAETLVNIDLGDILVSGIPCADFSTYGSRKGLSGPIRNVDPDLGAAHFDSHARLHHFGRGETFSQRRSSSVDAAGYAGLILHFHL